MSLVPAGRVICRNTGLMPPKQRSWLAGTVYTAGYVPGYLGLAKQKPAGLPQSLSLPHPGGGAPLSVGGAIPLG